VQLNNQEKKAEAILLGDSVSSAKAARAAGEGGGGKKLRRSAKVSRKMAYCLCERMVQGKGRVDQGKKVNTICREKGKNRALSQMFHKNLKRMGGSDAMIMGSGQRGTCALSGREV